MLTHHVLFDATGDNTAPLSNEAGTLGTPMQVPQQQQQAQLINPSRRSLMLVVPLVAAAAAGAAGAAAPGAQAAGEMPSMDDTCLECAGIGIVPCEWGAQRAACACSLVKDAQVPLLDSLHQRSRQAADFAGPDAIAHPTSLLMPAHTRR